MMTIYAPSPINIHIGSRVRLRRLLTDLTPEWFAEQIGISVLQLNKYEIGEEPIGPTQLLVASKVLSVSPTYFFEQEKTQALTMTGIMSPVIRALFATKDRQRPR
jgi:transcriptional regulator with XRE-family HTH domain